MDKIHSLIKHIYDEYGIYIIKSNNLTEKLGDEYITYNILSNGVSETHRDMGVRELEDGRIIRDRHIEYYTTLSFNSISNNEMKAYKNIIDLKDAFDYTMKENIYHALGITVLDTTGITDVTIRIIDANEYRFNMDVRLRMGRVISTDVSRIEESKINYGGR